MVFGHRTRAKGGPITDTILLVLMGLMVLIFVSVVAVGLPYELCCDKHPAAGAGDETLRGFAAIGRYLRP